MRAEMFDGHTVVMGRWDTTPKWLTANALCNIVTIAQLFIGMRSDKDWVN